MNDLLRSLHTDNGSDRVPTATPGTLSWIFNHPSFNSWLDDEAEGRILWISGKAGSGKSTLMNLLSRHLFSKRSLVSSFFFYQERSGSPTLSPHNTLLKSLLYQLFTSEPHCLPTDMLGAYSDHSELLGTWGKDWEWGDRELEGYLRQSTHNLGRLGHHLTLIVDGLDECYEHKATISFIQQTLAFPHIRICISSRPEVDYNLLGSQRIRLEDLNAKDIVLYVHSKLEISGLLDNIIKRAIAEKIARMAEGVFLWVTLVIDTLVIPSTAFEVEKRLDLLPQSVEEAYNTLYPRALRTALLWAAGSLRPLSVSELLDLLDTEEEMVNSTDNDLKPPSLAAKNSEELLHDAVDRLKQISAGLLTIATPEGWSISDCGSDIMSMSRLTVTFVHQSARDHFLKMYTVSRHPDADADEEMHLFLAFSSLRYLCFTDQELGRVAALDAVSNCDRESLANYPTNNQKALRPCFHCTTMVSNKRRSVHRSPRAQQGWQTFQRPFLGYAVVHYMDHLRLSGKLGANHPQFTQGLKSRRFLDRWVALYNMVSPENPVFRPGNTTTHHVLAYYDLPTHYHHWDLISPDAINEKDHEGRTALTIAAAMGHTLTCSILINKLKADTGIRDDVYNATPLVWASAYGHTEVVRLLLDAGASDEDGPDGCIPLHVAIRHGHLEVAKSLLHHGAGFSSLQAALYLAASHGRVPLINLLLQAGADVLAPDHRTGHTALHYAIHGGKKKTLELLLDVSSGDTKKLRELGTGTPPSWVSRILMKLMSDRDSNYMCHGRGTSQDSQSKSSNQADDRHVASTSQFKAKTSKPSSRKRPLSDTPEDSDGDGNGGPSEPPHKQLRSPARFCCPYHRRDPERYQGACANPGFPNIHRLKLVSFLHMSIIPL